MATDQAPKDVMGFLEYYLVDKAPFQLPANVKEWIVKYSPWITLVLLIILLPAILFVLGIGTIFLPLAAVTGTAGVLSLALVVLAVQLVVMAMSIPGLMQRKLSGWNLAFYGVIFNLVQEIAKANVLGGLVSALIGLYILFQIKSYYK